MGFNANAFTSTRTVSRDPPAALRHPGVNPAFALLLADLHRLRYPLVVGPKEGSMMRIEPKTAGAVSAAGFFFLLIFGIGWPGPGSWLLIFSLMFIAVGAVAWWLDGAIVQQTPTSGAVASGGPFRGGAMRGPLRRQKQSASLLLSLGLPGPDGTGRWVMPNRVHVTLVAGTVGVLAMVIFVGGAISGGGSAAVATTQEPQSSEAIDFGQPITPAESAAIVTEAVTPVTPGAGIQTTSEPTPIVVETQTSTRPELPQPADPVNAIGAPAIPAETIVHEVIGGDTIYDLAITFGSSIEAIMNANGISEFDTIRIGDVLIVPIQSS